MSESPEAEAAARIELRRGESLSGIVRDTLERLILSGELPPGERLNELALAARLGVSRGPLREALRALEQEGLVSGGAGQRGMSVRRLDATELAELYDARALLQGFICGLVARRARPEQVAGFRVQLGMLEAAGRADDAPLYFRLNLEFHEAMLAAAAHRRGAAMYRALLKESHPLRRLMLETPANRQASQEEHRRMVDAIAAGDVEAARQAGEAHVLSGKARWLQTLTG
ncbi:MAG: prpR [Roseomonas sp.]|jgi:DNA-binding GntR family transcriptional regulator|nr:prpR [Roseomonas sp.]